MLHIQYLMDTVTGLWFHGWEFTPSKPTSGHNFARALWARGNCWITISIPLFIELLAEDAKKRGTRFEESDPLRRFLVGTFRKQVDALLRTQEAKTGMWNTLLVDRESYIESSATAGFAAGIYMGLRMVSLGTRRWFVSLRLPLLMASLCRASYRVTTTCNPPTPLCKASSTVSDPTGNSITSRSEPGWDTTRIIIGIFLSPQCLMVRRWRVWR